MAADQDLLLRTAQGSVICAAKKEILLACGGAYIRIKDGNIEFGCPDRIIPKCATWFLEKPNSLNVEKTLPTPKVLEIWDEQVQLTTEDGVSLTGLPYFIEAEDGRIFSGYVNETGLLPRVTTDGQSAYKIYFGEHALERMCHAG